MLAVSATGGGWTEVIVALSIFVPVVIAAALTWWFFTGGKASDPDAERLKQVQRDYEQRQRENRGS